MAGEMCQDFRLWDGGGRRTALGTQPVAPNEYSAGSSLRLPVDYFMFRIALIAASWRTLRALLTVVYCRLSICI
jgi:hypothetical protein